MSVFLVETGGSRTPRPKGTPLEYTTGLSGVYFLASSANRRLRTESASQIGLRPRISASAGPHPEFIAPAPHPRGEMRADVAALGG